MIDWGVLETPLDPVPEFYVQAPDNRKDWTELARQTTFRKELRKCLPRARVVAVPNAAARGQKALNRAKAEGAAWGFPDVMVIHEGQIAFLEFKNATATPARHQIEWLNWLNKQFDCAVVRTAEGALAFLKDKGWPIRAA